VDSRGLKQEQLDEIVHQNNLSAMLAGKRKISATLAGKLGKFCDVSPAVLVPKSFLMPRTTIHNRKRS